MILQVDFLLFYATPAPNNEADFLGNLCNCEREVRVHFQQPMNNYFVNCSGWGGLRS